MTVTAPAHQYTSRIEDALAANRLGVRSVLGYVLSGVAPLLVAAGVITAGFAITGVTAMPFLLGVVAVVLAVFAVPYLSMARHVSNAGAFYSYISTGLGRVAGVTAAMVSVCAYNFLQVALYGLAGTFLSSLAGHPWWAWALAAWAVVSVLGHLDVKWVSAVLGALIVVEIVYILALSLVGLAHPAAGVSYLAALSPHGLTGATGPVGGATAVLGFIGFEAAPVYREEAKRATWTIIAATAAALGLMLVTYGLASWAMTVHYGPATVDTARTLGPDMLFGLAGSGLPADIAKALFVSSVFAAMMAFHNAVTRYSYVLGREGVLPRALARVNRHRAPSTASTVQSVIGLAAIGLFAVNGWDPQVRMFFWLGQTGGFYVLGLLAVTALTVLVFYLRHPALRRRTSVWVWLIAPLLTGTALGWLFAQIWRNYSTLLGEQSPTLASRLLPASILAAAAVGLGRAGWLYVFGRPVFDRINRAAVTSAGGPL